MRAQSSSGGAEDKNHATCFCGAVQIETTGQVTAFTHSPHDVLVSTDHKT